MIAISVCVLLLATYCHSVPVTPRSTTVNYQYTTGATMGRVNNTVNWSSMNSAESTGATILQKPRGVVASNSIEYTTSAPFGKPTGSVPFVSSKSSNPAATMDAAEKTFLNNFNKFQFTTMENKKQFQKKAFGSDFEETEDEEAESKRDVQDDDLEEEPVAESKRDVQDDDFEAEPEAESKRDVQDDDFEGEPEAESKRETHDDDLEEEPVAESKRDVQDDDFEEEPETESKREIQDNDFEEDEASKREARDNDFEEDEESKREARDDDFEEESESKRGLSFNSLEVTTSSMGSGSPKTFKSMNSAESRENSKVLPFTTSPLRKSTVGRMGQPSLSSSEEMTTASTKIVYKTPVKVTV